MTYFEYMKRREIKYEELVELFTEWYLMCLDWKVDDKRYIERNKARDLIVAAIDDSYKEKELKGDSVYYSEDGSLIDYTNGTISIRSVANYLISKITSNKFDAPKDFLCLLKGERVYYHMLRENQADKLLCQVIAQTLWYEHPDMTIEQIYNHYAIQNYGNGRLYTDDKTVRGWLSNVDSRNNKRGPKKK